MKLGANSVLFGGFDMETAFKYIAMAGYDGVEVSAIPNMSEHMVLDNWQVIAPEVKRLAKVYELELLAMEQPMRDPAVMERAMQAAVECGIPIVNCGPGGESPRTTRRRSLRGATRCSCPRRRGRPLHSEPNSPIRS